MKRSGVLSVGILVIAVFLSAMSMASGREPFWNQFCGPEQNNHSFTTGLPKEWSQAGPELLWNIDGLGAGYSNISFYADKIYTMGDIGNECFVIALNENDGSLAWKTAIAPAAAPGRYAGPRATPAVCEKYVFAFNQLGIFVCLDREKGSILWKVDAPATLDAGYANNWGYAPSPFFDGDKVIVQVGGNDETGSLLVAFSPEGEILWRSTELADRSTYATPIIAEIDGKRQYIVFVNSGVYGVRAEDGTILWGAIRPASRAICSSPVYKDGVVFVSQSYNFGSNAYNVTGASRTGLAAQLYEDQSLQNHHGGLVLVGDYLYFTSDRELVCVQLTDGEVVWRNRCVGKGSLTFVDGILIVRSESGDGTIAFVEATPTGYKERCRFEQPERSDKNSWTYPVVVEGKLYIRDQGILLCYQLK